jgi:hypothetical protein
MISEPATHPPAPIALAAAPARLQLVAGSSGTVRVTNPGGRPVIVDATPAGFAVDAHGRPRIRSRGGRSAAAWLGVAPRRLALPPAGSAVLRLSALVPRGASPGDHTALLLLATQPLRRSSVPTRIRIGVVVVVRVPGRIVRRVVLQAVRVRRHGHARVLEVSIVDRGNVDEWVGARRLSIAVVRNGRVLARPRPVGRRFLARTSGVAVARAPERLRGPVRVIVSLAHPRPGVAMARRNYHLRL